jgi:hypothetical protein
MSKRILWLALFALPNILFAQAPSTDNPTKLDYNILSPNTAEFEKFGNVPVNNFSGLPSISVPVYQVVAGKHSLPISISYHAGGIRVDDLSGDAGVGWNLNAGYKITRVLRGKKDESGYVGHNDAQNIIKVTNPQSNDANADSFKAVADGIWDTQPDEFNFSIGGASGKFIIAPDRVIVIPDQDVKVSYSTTTGANFQFVLTDALGIQYYFNDFSTTSSESCQGIGAMSYASSWSISKIIYPDTKDSIRFNYTTEMQEIPSSSETRNYDYEGLPRPVKYKICPSAAIISEQKISGIYFPNGKVVFTYGQQKFELPGTYALSNIEVFNQFSESQRKFVLGYNYYNNTSSDNYSKKLRLDSVYTITADNTITGKYLFQYESSNIPPYQSKAKDHWGFYNGKPNSSLIPGNTFSVYDANGLPVPVPGGNREVDPFEAKKGVLNKIIYPAGGYSVFEYESNNAGRDCGANAYIAEPIYTYNTYVSTSSCKFINSPGYQQNTTTFTAPGTQNVTIQVITNQVNCTGNSRNYIVKDLTANQVIAQGISSVNVSLTGGHQYSLYTETDCRSAEANMLDCEEKMSISITVATLTGTNKNKLVGGLRVKKITDFDPYSTVAKVRSYTYTMPGEPDRSSGLLVFKPKYDYVYYYVEEQGYPNPVFKTVTSYAFTSEANNTSQSNDGAVVYQYVKETIGAAGEGGSTLNTYSIPYRSCDITYPFAPATSYRHRNGQLLAADIFDKDGLLKQHVVNYYSYIPAGDIKGWKTAYQKMKSNSQPHDVFNGIIYSYISEKIRLDSTFTRTVYPADNMEQWQYLSYLGNGSYYPYKSVTKNSQGDVLTSVNWRSSDFNVSATGLMGISAALRYMQDNHLTDYPIENYSLSNGAVTGGSINEYLLFDNLDKFLILPAQTFKLRVAEPIKLQRVE